MKDELNPSVKVDDEDEEDNEEDVDIVEAAYWIVGEAKEIIEEEDKAKEYVPWGIVAFILSLYGSTIYF